MISNDALGNYVVVTPLFQMLRAKFPYAKIAYFSGPRTEELWGCDPQIDFGGYVFGKTPAEAIDRAREQGPFDLIVNVEWTAWPKSLAGLLATEDTWVVGPCLGPTGRSDLQWSDDLQGQLWQDQEWIAPDIRTRYSFLDSSFIGEIFCRLAYLEGPVPRYSVPTQAPPGEVPDILIAMSASLPEKLWPGDKWNAALAALRDQGRSVGLLGAPPASQGKFWLGNAAEQEVVDLGLAQDLRGRYTMPQVVGALAQAKLVLTLDNGILHLAASTMTPTIGLFREGIHRLWAPPAQNIEVLTPKPGEIVSEISVEQVLEAVRRVG